MFSEERTDEETGDTIWLVKQLVVYFARMKSWSKAKLFAERRRSGEKVGEEEDDRIKNIIKIFGDGNG